jgi:hypothetical protein
MHQLPASTLSSNALVKVPKVDAEFGGEFDEPVNIRRVRLDGVDSIRSTPYALAEDTTGLLFVDAVISVGAFEVPAGSKVSLDGGATWSSVNACHRFETFGGRTHHWELEVR